MTLRTSDQDVLEVELLPPKPRSEIIDERLDEIEAKLEERYGEIVLFLSRFPQLSRDASTPPPSWFAELGEEKAWEAFRVASAAWEKSADAPVGISAAQKIYPALVSARLKKPNNAPRQLNMTMVQYVVDKPEELKRLPPIEAKDREG